MIGSKLKNARVKLGMTQKELAEKLSVSRPTISHMELLPDETPDRMKTYTQEKLFELLAENDVTPE